MSEENPIRKASDPSEAAPRRLGPLNLMEVSGALGDLGTFLPLWLGMVTICGLDPGISLILAGVANVITGLVFGIPMPVQPMKAIAAIAIALGLSQGDIAAAGLSMGILVLLLALTGGFDRLQDWIPLPVVRGVQWAVALKLVLAGTKMFFVAPGQLQSWLGAEGLWWAPIGLVVLILLRRNRLMPGAVAVLLIGLMGAAWVSAHSPGEVQALGTKWAVIVPSLSEWGRGFTRGALPQLPMTALNSVVAVCALAWSLFPQRTNRLTPRSIAVSVGLMNLVAAPLGGMPMCHGSGGLAAQYGFGARSGTSVVFLGSMKIVVGVLFATPAMVLLFNFPKALLGTWILAAGIELVRYTAKISKRDLMLALLVPVAVAASVPLAWAACAAWLVSVIVYRIRSSDDESRYSIGRVCISRRHSEVARATRPE